VVEQYSEQFTALMSCKKLSKKLGKFIYLFILHSMHAAIKAMAVNRHMVKDVNT